MTKSISLGYTDTPIVGYTEQKTTRGALNFSRDFRVKSIQPGKEVVLTNITSPVDRPEKVRIAFSEVANVYSGSGIDASVLAPTKGGVSILVQLTNIMSVTDDANPDYRIDLPLSYHLVIKAPASEYISAAEIQEGLSRLLSCLYDSGSSETTRLEAIMRGSLEPTEI